MIRDIIKDKFFLSLPSNEATIEDVYIGIDLMDTLKFNSNKCVGLAANMIGELKTILILKSNNGYILMFNPKVLSKSQETYLTEEGCLSFEGTKRVKRYKKIKIGYYDMNFTYKIKTFNDFEAQIIQHEMDHFNGVLI